MASDNKDRRAAATAQVELLVVRLWFLETRYPGVVERAVRAFEQEAGTEPGAREAIAIVRARFGLRQSP